jgi:hypothetical protein
MTPEHLETMKRALIIAALAGCVACSGSQAGAS